MKSHLNWKLLKDNRCPQCGSLFGKFTLERIICKCGFTISEKRYKEIVSDIMTREYDKEMDRKTDQFLEGFGIEN